MEKLFEAMNEIALDDTNVADINWWLQQENGKRFCPRTRSNFIADIVECKKICYKLWHDLKDCPCYENKPVKYVFQMISDLAVVKRLPKKQEPVKERTYQRGDVFVFITNNIFRKVMLCQIDYNCFLAMAFDGNRYFHEGKVIVGDPNAITKDEVNKILKGYAYKYLGNISELTIKNGEVVVEEEKKEAMSKITIGPGGVYCLG